MEVVATTKHSCKWTESGLKQSDVTLLGIEIVRFVIKDKFSVSKRDKSVNQNKQ